MYKIIHDNCALAISQIPDESIDLVITSPPYKTIDGFSYALMADAFQQLYRVQKPNTLFFLNFGHLAEDKLRPFAVCELAVAQGYKLNDTIVWVKNHYKPIQGNKRLNNLTEFIFMLYKGRMPLLNRLALGVPYKDKTNAKRFAGGRDLKCGGNVWHINYETITSSSEKSHHDRFPLELPERCIKLCGYDVKIVIDPFCGSATTGIAAQNMGKDFMGIEYSETHYKTAMGRMFEKP